MLRRIPLLLSVLCVTFLTYQAFADNATDELMASFTKLGQVKSYRMKTTVIPGQQYAQQMEMAKQMGFDMAMKPMLQEVVNPNLRKMTMEIPLMSMPSIPSMGSMQDMKNMPKNMPSMSMPKLHQMKMYGVYNGSGVATYLDCPECQKDIDDSMRQQLKQSEKMLTESLLKSVLSGPQGLITAAVDAGILATEQKMAQKMTEKAEKEMSLNQWTCRDAKVEEADKTSPPSLMNVKATGKATVGTEEAKTYQFTVKDQNSDREMTVTVYVSAASGLPMKMEMSQPEGSVAMEYYDVDAPITIDIPDCMKK